MVLSLSDKLLFFGSGYLFTLFFLPIFIKVLRKGGATHLNYRGEVIPVGVGSVFLFTCFASAVLAFIWYPQQRILPFLAGLTLFSFLGFLDDSLGSSESKGLRGHLKAFLRGKPTTGGLKAIGGMLGALLVSTATIPSGHWWEILVSTLLISLAANFVNLLDLRPGRAIKGFFVWFVILLGFQELPVILLFPLVGGLLAYAPHDLKSRVMLGDAGSNLLGSSLGMVTVWSFDLPVQLVFVSILVLLHLFTEKYSLTELIEKNSLLKFLDKLGREEQGKGES